MHLTEALDTVINRTGHHRFAWLTSEDNPDPHSREAYRSLVIQLAGGQFKPALPDPPVDQWPARIRACPDYNPGCCASPAPFCERFMINPTRENCIECLSIESVK